MNKILIAIVLLGLVGCDKPPVKHVERFRIPEHTGRIVEFSYYKGFSLRRFKFSDGVDCVSSLHGLDCNFPGR